MANPYYNVTGTPATSSGGSSAAIRAEFSNIEDGFALLPALSGGAGRAVVVNSSDDGLTLTTGQLALGGDLSITAGKALAVFNSVSFTGTDNSSVDFGTGGLVVYQTTAAWTPTDASGAGLTFANVSCAYTKLGNLVFAYATFSYPVNGNALPAEFAGLPFPVPNHPYAFTPAIVSTTPMISVLVRPIINSSMAQFISSSNGASSQITNGQLSGSIVSFMLIYPVS